MTNPYGGYPQQPGQPQGGYPQQPYQPGPPAGGFPAFTGGGSGGGDDYDFAQLWGQADHSSGFLYPEAWYDAVVEEASYGRTKDGTKGAWTIKFRTTTGQDAGRSPITTTLSISPVKNDGSPNPQGLGILYRHLAALGIPVPDPSDPTGRSVLNGTAPFWAMGMKSPDVARMMVGRPAYIKVIHNEFDSGVNNKIRDIKPPRPGAPTSWPQQAQPQGFNPQAPAQPGYGPAAPQPQYAPPQPPYPAQPGAGYPQQPYPQQPQQAPWQPQQPPPGYGQPQQNAGPGYQQPPQVPGAPAWAQPAVPGAGGAAEFTPQGQSYQPGTTPAPGQVPPVPQPPWQQPQPPQGQAPQGYPPNGQPGQPPAAQGGPGEANPGQMPWYG